MGNADITLRHVARRHPEGLVAFVASMAVPKGVQVLGWHDTQLTALAVERRSDKVLDVRIAGEPRALVIEFEYELRSTMGARIVRNEAMLSLPGALGPSLPSTPPIATLVIVLTGRRKGWPRELPHRTGWPELGFSGVHYLVDAVYQRTVAELCARGSVLWLVFTPLAVDATAPALRRVVAELRARVPDREELGEMFATMMVLADLDPWEYHLSKEIAAMIEEESVDLIHVSRTLRNAFEKGKLQGVEEGIEKGKLEGIEKGKLEGIEKGKLEGIEKGKLEGKQEGIERMLSRLFMRRIGRGLTEAEQEALSAKVKAGDPEAVEDCALTLEGERLAAWLLDPQG